jgi:hypothetical protein
VTVYQQSICKTETPKNQQYLMQTHCLDQLQHVEVQSTMEAEIAPPQEVQNTQGHLRANSQQSQQLQTQLSLLVLSGEGDGVDKRMKRLLGPICPWQRI